MSVSDPRLLERLEEALSCNVPFGDWAYIDGSTRQRYERRLEMLAAHLPDAAPLLAALRGASAESRYKVLGDPVVRGTINATLGALELNVPGFSLERARAVLAESTRSLVEDRRTAPTEEGARQRRHLGPASHHGWIWCDEREEDIWGQGFRELFAREPSRSALRTPDESAMGVLTRATAILEDLLPRIAHGALSHAHVVAVTDVLDRQEWSNDQRRFPYESFSTSIIPGTVFVSLLVLRNPYKAAEHLLHEALHLKYYDLQHTHAIFRKGYHVERSPRLVSLWNRAQRGSSNEWPVCRSLAAMHVYVHLALYFMQLERRREEMESLHGPLNGYDPTRLKVQALERGRYLGMSLRCMGWQELRLGGQRMVDWMLEMLEQLGAGPAPEDDGVHLLLDLYEREATDFGWMMDSLPANAEEERRLARRRLVMDMIRGELGLAGRIASMLGQAAWQGGDAEQALPARLSQANDTELVQTLRATRSSVASLLRGVKPEQFTHVREEQTQRPLSALVREMVESSGTQLNVLASGGPRP